MAEFRLNHVRQVLLQVTEAGERSMQLRILVSSANSPKNWDLRCHVREALIGLMQARYAEFLPTLRVLDQPGQPGPAVTRAGLRSGAGGSDTSADP